jgi:septal ring factor EnvC (AmiA/AmiB activator)
MTRRRAHIIMLAIVCALVFAGGVSGQDELKKKKTQLQKIKKDIDAYEAKIKESQKKEHATLELLDTYDRQAVLLRKLIASLHEEEKSLQLSIDSTRASISSMNGQLNFLTQHYAHYASSIYKHGKMYDLELLIASRSLNEVLLRAEYIRRFSSQRKNDLTKIGTRRDDYQIQNDILQKQLAEERELIAEKSTEEANLRLKMKKRKVLLTEIRRDKKNYQKEMSRKLEAAKQMEQLIAKLIEEDRARRAKEEERPKEKNAGPRDHTAPGVFEAHRGRLRWPVSTGKVVARFGNHENPTLHTVTQNPGIDIAVAAGTAVEAVTDGEVSLISWLPSYGNLVILNHKSGFRTVYAHLSEINVNEGESVSEGDRIASSGEALSGPMLHFEIWKDRDKQDPEDWLKPRAAASR